VSPAREAHSTMRTIGLLVFVSGFSALVYQIVWVRALGRVFGTSTPAIATVVAAFMGGLALGGLAFGRRADRSPAPLRLYARVEVAIALSATAVTLLLAYGGGLLDGVARLTSAAGPGARAAVAFALVLAPTTVMGATLPVLTRALARAGAVGGVLGFVYAANTAGAVLGALAPDALLVPTLGLTRTSLLASVGNLAVALVASRMTLATSPPPADAPADEPLPRAPLAVFVASGFCAMGWELLWSRVLEHLMAGLILGFSILLAVNLVSLAIGARLAAGRADRVDRPATVAAALLGLTAVAVVAPLAALDPAIRFIDGLFPRDPALLRVAPSVTWAKTALFALWLELPACLLMGAAFPFVAAAAVRARDAGRTSGRLYAWNTLAGVLGALATAFVLLPRAGTQGAALGLCALAAATALAVAARDAGPRRVVVGLCFAAVVVAAVGLPRDRLRSALLGFPPARAVYLREGATTTAAVVPHLAFGRAVSRELRTPGVSMSDTSFAARRYMGVMAHLPMFLARERRSALLICYGVGNTARSLLAHRDLARLDVVDLSREVIDASPHFAAVTSGDPLRDPRAHVVIDDGRHHLVTTRERYDVITSEPPPPNHAGVANLYAREYYRAARRVLRPGGALTQWFPLAQLASEETLAMVGAMAAEFPWVGLFYGYANQWLVVAMEAPPRIDLDAWDARAAAAPIAADFRAMGVVGAEDLVGAWLQGDAGLRAAARDVRPVSDDFPSIQYPSRAIRKPTEVPRGLVGDPRDVLALLAPGTSAPALSRAEAATAVMRAVARALPLAVLAPPELRELTFGAALRPALAARPAHPAVLALLGLDDDRVAAARAAPSRPDARFLLARRAFYAGDYARSAALLADVPPEAVGAAQHALLVGGSARALGRPDEAATAFREVARRTPVAWVRAQAEALAAQAAAPWPRELGPLALATQR
jgi:spermidine synthase